MGWDSNDERTRLQLSLEPFEHVRSNVCQCKQNFLFLAVDCNLTLTVTPFCDREIVIRPWSTVLK